MAGSKVSKQKKAIRLLTVFALLLCPAVWFALQSIVDGPPLRASSGTFLVSPYLQLGPSGDPHKPSLLWATVDSKINWTVDTSTGGGVKAIHSRVAKLQGLPEFRIYEAQLGPLPDSTAVTYSVNRNGKTIFTGTVNPIESKADACKIIVTGDIASGSLGQREVAKQMFAAKPDLVMVAGDIVYKFGRTLEYLDHFFPVYNAQAGSDEGVPMMPNTLYVAAPGNHDTAMGSGETSRNLEIFPDGLGYFLWWRQPLNGPDIKPEGPDAPTPTGSEARRQAFFQAAGDTYPRQTNFSFDYGNTHWVIIDSNPYVDWSKQSLRDWLSKDLSGAKQPWKFVLFHHTAFNSDHHHFGEERMRILSDIFQKNSVDIVFAGHVHNYQRTRPLKFAMKPWPDGRLVADNGTVQGTFDFDMKFDGKGNSTPTAPIYITTGGGGAPLTGDLVAGKPQIWQPFTVKMLSTHSFTVLDIKDKKLRLQQIDDNGRQVDEIAIQKK